MMAPTYHYLHNAVNLFKDTVKGTGVFRHLAALRHEQYLPPDKLEGLQAERLKNLLVHARIHSPYYRELFRSNNIVPGIGNIARLNEIPILGREQLQANFKHILCDNAVGVMANSSGGSTGNPVNFFQDINYYAYGWAANLLFMDWMGIRSGDKTAVFWGSDKEIRELSAKDKAWMRFDRIRVLNSFSMTDKAIADFIEELNDFKPVFIHGYAGSLYLIARVINSTKPLTFTPKAIRSSAEMLYDFQRLEIERAFGARVFNFYGSREVNNLAAECGVHEGLHILSSGRIVEIVDDCGKPLPDGETGHVVVTDLTNYTFPFIRYLNGDMAVKSVKPCACGRTYPLLERIEGRSSDIIAINGRHIHGEYFTHLFYGKPEVRQFQVIQEDAATLRILVVLRDRSGNIDDVISKIKKSVGDNINIIVEKRDQIAVTGTGKYRFTISKLPQAAPGSLVK